MRSSLLNDLEPLRSRLHPLFFGDDGLRAGWSIALFLLPFAAFFAVASLQPANSGARPAPAIPQEITPGLLIFGDGLPLFFALAAALLMARIERRPFAHYGLKLERMAPDFAAGLLWGLLAVSALVGSLWLSHAIRFDGRLQHSGAALLFGVKWAVACLLVGVFEEFLFRGYLQFTLSRGVAGIVRALAPRNPRAHGIGFWFAALVLSGGVFALTHTSNQGETPTGIVAVGVAGAVFAFSLWRTGSLWWAIGFHSAWDWAQSFLYGTPDSGSVSQGRLLRTHPIGARWLSGGSDGPEGSLLVIPTLLLVALVIQRTLPRRGYPLTPDQAKPKGSPEQQRTPPPPRSTA